MKLSEAIRLGAMLKPQAFYSPWGEDQDQSCAIAAACDATGYRYDSTDLPRLFKIQFPRCPVCEMKAMHPAVCFEVIAHLNDHHQWPRERIADWVESIEALESAPVETEAPCAVQN